MYTQHKLLRGTPRLITDYSSSAFSMYFFNSSNTFSAISTQIVIEATAPTTLAKRTKSCSLQTSGATKLLQFEDSTPHSPSIFSPPCLLFLSPVKWVLRTYMASSLGNTGAFFVIFVTILSLELTSPVVDG